MNFLISLILTTSVMANSIINISYKEHHQINANIVKNRLINHYKIPEILVSLRRGHCLKTDSNKIELCIEKNGKLKILQKNSELISSLQIFNRPY